MIGYEGGLVSLQYKESDPLILDADQVKELSREAVDVVSSYGVEPFDKPLGLGVNVYWQDDGYRGIHIRATNGEGIYIQPRYWNGLMRALHEYTLYFKEEATMNSQKHCY